MKILKTILTIIFFVFLAIVSVAQNDTVQQQVELDSSQFYNIQVLPEGAQGRNCLQEIEKLTYGTFKMPLTDYDKLDSICSKYVTVKIMDHGKEDGILKITIHAGVWDPRTLDIQYGENVPEAFKVEFEKITNGSTEYYFEGNDDDLFDSVCLKYGVDAAFIEDYETMRFILVFHKIP